MSGSIVDQAFFHPALEQKRFPKTSRYHTTELAIHTAGDGTPVPYLKRRFPPQPARLETIGTYTAAAPARPARFGGLDGIGTGGVVVAAGRWRRRVRPGPRGGPARHAGAPDPGPRRHGMMRP